MTEGKRRTNFEPGMIFTLDHIKKDDLHFDVDAEIERVKAQKDEKQKAPSSGRNEPQPKVPKLEPGLK